jgi:hypothetical protein
MEGCFGANCMNSRGRYIFKKARKVRWKKVVKYKSIH